MYLKSLKTFKLRNLEDGELQFSPRLNLIHGKNGQGKTNIVEAIHILSSTKSFRTSKLRELCRWGEKEASIHGKATLTDGDINLGLIVEGGKKRFLLNGKDSSAVECVGKLLCVTFSPYDIELVKGAPLLRRQFLDKHSVDLHPGLLSYIIHYNKALKNKQHLLKTGVTNNQSLDAWDRVLADAATVIIENRRRFISLLGGALQSVFSQFASADGTIEVKLEETFDGEASSDAIFKRFQESRSYDINHRTVSVGPHRDDLAISIEGRSTRLYASQGQSKSVALALKLSALKLLEEERGQLAIFLLDDVDSELDEDRLRKLYSMIQQADRQIFITGTEPRMSYLTGDFEGEIFRVEGVKVFGKATAGMAA